MGKINKDILLGMLRGGQPMTFGQQAKLAGIMSMPAILAQLSSVLMQFIDSAMVGNLGVNAAAGNHSTAHIQCDSGIDRNLHQP